jgi:hypothetical protein
MSGRIITAVAIFATLMACERRPAAGGDQAETGASPAVTDTVSGAQTMDTARGDQTSGAAGRDTATTPPGYSGMERDTSAAGAARTGKMDSFRLKQETGQDTGGYSGAERGRPGEDTARQVPDTSAGQR